MNTVCAIIVTFNRPDILKECLAALMTQSGLDHIHVVINSPDPHTIGVTQSFDESHFISYEVHDNPGPAGGFHHGLKWFLNQKYSFCWLMDDDVVVGENCLKQLVLCSVQHEYIYPRVVKGDGKEIVSFGWWGVLIKRDLIMRAGLPIAELFFWKEDTEYLQNRLMRVYGVAPFRCLSAVANHLHLRKKKRPSWYYYYTVRNTLYYHNYIAGYTWYRVKKTFVLFPHALFMILFREDNKLRKMRLVSIGIFHGIIGKIGKLIDPALNT